MKKILIFVLTLHVSSFLSSQVLKASSDVILQSFSWNSYTSSNWNALKTQSEELSEYFEWLWLPPSGRHGGVKWNELSMGYLPLYYFNQNSSFGTQEELKSLISTLKNKGTKCIADIVINHRVGETNWIDFPIETYLGKNYAWDLSTICNNDKETDCNASCITGYIGEPQGADDTGEAYHAARDIDHTNELVRETIKAYLHFMKNEMGYTAWRYDFVKGYGSEFVKEYNESSNIEFSVGEYYDFNESLISTWLSSADYASMVFDFPLKKRLNMVFNENKSYKNLGVLEDIHYYPLSFFEYNQQNYSVSFVDNHDTGRTDGGDGAYPLLKNILPAYAYILTHSAIPCVWWEHWQNTSYRDAIKAMIYLRKKAGITNSSNVYINEIEDASYVASIIGERAKVLLKLGITSFSPSEDYSLYMKGDLFEIWTSLQDVSLKKKQIEKGIEVFPNPTKDKLKIHSKERITKISLYTIEGKELLSREPIALKVDLDLLGLEKALYILKIHLADGLIWTQKIIKE